MDFTELARKRFTVRMYSSRELEKEKLDEILEVALLSPTAKNQQPQKIYVLQSREALEKLDTLTPCRYGAPVALIFCYSEREEWKNDMEPGAHSGVQDVSIAAAHVMLKAADIGVDSTWVNMFSNSKLERAFDLPENERAVLVMNLGYREKGVGPGPTHKITKNISEMVKYL